MRPLDASGCGACWDTGCHSRPLHHHRPSGEYCCCATTRGCATGSSSIAPASMLRSGQSDDRLRPHCPLSNAREPSLVRSLGPAGGRSVMYFTFGPGERASCPTAAWAVRVHPWDPCGRPAAAGGRCSADSCRRTRQTGSGGIEPDRTRRSASSGAPQAQQVAECWHLLHNLVEIVERILKRNRGALVEAPPEADSDADEIRPGCAVMVSRRVR